jgi:serine phosphatase RsbU (regulator of sigma subunit)
MIFKLRGLILFLLFCLNFNALAQTIYIEGNVFSYNSKKIALIKKAQKDLSFEGPLSNAQIKCVGQKTATSYSTGINGFFSVALGAPGIYQISISKDGYSSISFVINYRSASRIKYFESVFLILKQEENSIIDLGTIEIENDKLSLSEGNSKNSSSQDVFNSNINLLEKAVNINNNSKPGQFPARPSETNVINTNTNTDSLLKADKQFLSPEKIRAARALEMENLDSLKKAVEDSRNLLNTLSPESDDYKFLSQQINLALQKIQDKEKIIALQNAQIYDSGKIILYLSLFLLFLFLSLAITFYFFREKKKSATSLLHVNDKISRINSRLLGSIRYASIIQENFLHPVSGLKKIFGDSFLYSKPKDILSGDFHWYTEKDGYKIVAVADCTGHGVPGAMLTVLGNRLLDEIIIEKGKVLPSEILYELNTAIQETFSSRESLDYGMDISLVSLNVKTGELLFSGIGNGMYKVSGKQLDFFPVTPKSIGNELYKTDLEDKRIEYVKGDSFFLFSDGYADQFSGNDPKRTKYNLKRFAELLVKVSQDKNLSLAPERLDNELKSWMGENNLQVDDICILGFRL